MASIISWAWRKTTRLTAEIAEELAAAKKQFEATGEAARVFKDFTYRTLDSWSRARRVVGKAEHLDKGRIRGSS